MESYRNFSGSYKEEPLHLFTNGEVIFLSILFGALVLTAVVGNAVVCILLRFRYMPSVRYLRTLCARCSNKPASYYNESNPADLWADECTSSQHECSCGKQCVQSQPPGRFVVFTSIRQIQRENSGTFKTSMRIIDPPPKMSRQRFPTIQDHEHKRFFRRYQRIGQRNSITSLFLFNLSLADFLMAVMCTPTYVVTEIIYLSWPLGLTLCKTVAYAQGISVFVSALTHVVISWDRFILVYFPLRPRITYRRAITLLLGVWTLACIIPLPLPIINKLEQYDNTTHCVEDWSVLFPSLRSNKNRSGQYEDYAFEVFGYEMKFDISFAYTIILMILQYFLPLGVICGTYTAIAIRVRKLQTPGEGNYSRDHSIMVARRKMVKMLAFLAVMYGLSQLPRHTLYLHGSIHREIWTYPWSVKAWAAATFARDSATCYNPFIYAWANKNFRSDVYKLFKGLLKPCLSLLHSFHGQRKPANPARVLRNRGRDKLGDEILRPLNSARVQNKYPPYLTRCQVIPMRYAATTAVCSSSSVPRSNSRTSMRTM